MSTRREPIVIVGTGAMACLFGARLAPYAEVTLLGTWLEGLAALRRDGIRLEDDDRSARAHVRVAAHPAECAGARHALVLVKSWQTPRAARMLEACLAPDGVAITLQNGLGNLVWLLERVGEGRALQGVTTSGATLLGPGHVRAGGDGPTYVSAQRAATPMAGLLAQAGFPVERVEDVEALAWGKAVVNAAVNPITALLRVPNGELLNPARAGAWALAADAAVEAARVAEARGVHLAFDDPAAQVAEVVRRTASNRSSMLQDVERGRPTEVDAINGMVVTEGDRLAVATPVNRVLWRLVRGAGPLSQGGAT